MQWIREWIMQISGIIALGAVCDLIMTNDEIKKYVKMVIGLVMVFAVVRPIANFAPEISEIKLPESTQVKAARLKESVSETEQQEIIRIYTAKLEKSVENQIYSDLGFEVSAEIKVEEKNEQTFGNIVFAKIAVKSADKEYAEKIKSTVSKNFDVGYERIKIDII